MPPPLATNYLTPNASFVIEMLVMLVVVGLLVGGLLWLLLGRRGSSSRR